MLPDGSSVRQRERRAPPLKVALDTALPMERLVEYIAVIGEAPGGASALPTVLRRLPENDWSSTPFPSHVGAFAFAAEVIQDVTLSPKREAGTADSGSAACHVAVLTLADHTHVYAAFLEYRRPHGDGRLHEGSERHALCVISRSSQV